MCRLAPLSGFRPLTIAMQRMAANIWELVSITFLAQRDALDTPVPMRSNNPALAKMGSLFSEAADVWATFSSRRGDLISLIKKDRGKKYSSLEILTKNIVIQNNMITY